MYLFIENEKIIGAGGCECVNEDVQNIEVEQEVYDRYIEDVDRYIWNGTAVIENPEYDEIISQREKDKRIAEIKAELEEIDLKSIRPARAGETERLEELEAQAVKLREELKELNA